MPRTWLLGCNQTSPMILFLASDEAAFFSVLIMGLNEKRYPKATPGRVCQKVEQHDHQLRITMRT